MIVILHNVSYHCRKLSAPDESSTPLVRSSERLAAKRRGLQAESLETLYFTPINARQMNRYVLHLTVERLTVDVSVFLGFIILLCPTLHCQQAIVVLTPDSIYIYGNMYENK